MNDADTEWREGDYGAYSWHDNRIRAIRFRSPLEGYDNDLIFEIDYITEWLRKGDSFSFLIAPAWLIFHDADDVVVNFILPYKQDMDIDCIERRGASTEAEIQRGFRKYRWRICCHGFTREQRIEFTASAFDLRLMGNPVVQARQRLEDPPLPSQPVGQP